MINPLGPLKLLDFDDRVPKSVQKEQQQQQKKGTQNLGIAHTVMAFPVLMPKTEYMRLPIPDYSEIKAPPSQTVGIPVPGNPQPMQTFPRKR